MAVGVVPGNAVAQPDHVGHAQMLKQGFASRSAAQAGIADLGLLVQQAFLGGQQRAPPVAVDGPAFKDHGPVPWRRSGVMGMSKDPG
jgi:hypothetical protein